MKDYNHTNTTAAIKGYKEGKNPKSIECAPNSSNNNKINYYLKQATMEAKKALNHHEVPVGAVVVYQDQIIGRGYNQPITTHDATMHAEIVAIKEASCYLKNYRLINCELYVTLEPCLMCIGAILQSRIKRVIFGARENKTGAIISQYNILDNKAVNHHTLAIGPIDHEYYITLIREFFLNKRKEKLKTKLNPTNSNH